MDGLPDNVRQVLDNERMGGLTRITTRVLSTSPHWGTPESLYALRKPNLVGIVRSLGLRNVQRLRKVSLVNIIWLDIPDTNTAEAFDWLDNSSWAPRDYDILRYVLLYFYRNALPPGEIPQLHGDYTFGALTDFRHTDPRKMKFLFCMQFFFVYKNFPGTVSQFRTVCMEAFAHVRSLGYLSSPSVSIRLPRHRRPGGRSAPVERIPAHVVEWIVNMYTKSDEQKECPICLEAIAGEDLRITNCGHCFHKECLGRVVRDVCPTCRTRGL